MDKQYRIFEIEQDKRDLKEYLVTCKECKMNLPIIADKVIHKSIFENTYEIHIEGNHEMITVKIGASAMEME